MGKASRWLRALLGTKKNSDSSPGSAGSESRSGKGNKKWGFAHHSNGSGGLSSVNASKSATITSPYAEGIDANKHAIAVAAATAAVAEAALAAAQAAAEVVRLTSGGGRPRIGGGYDRRRDLAAVKIQSAFRAYLARRALRALKGLVKLQAIVRGRIVRKQSTDMLRRMQALARIQARACANRALITDSAYSRSKSAQYNYYGSAMPKKRDQQHGLYSNKPDGSILKRVGSKLNTNENIGLDRNLGSSWLDHWMEESSLKTGLVDDEKSDKILEIDNWKPPINPNRRNDGLNLPTFDSNSRHQLKPRNPNHNLSFGSLKSPNVRLEAEQAGQWVNESSPHAHSATSRPGSSGGRRGPFTPARSECSRSLFGEYVGHPNYMVNTESYRAKLRSHSAPRQRPGSARRFQYGPWDLDTVSERGVPISHANFRA